MAGTQRPINTLMTLNILCISRRSRSQCPSSLALLLLLTVGALPAHGQSTASSQSGAEMQANVKSLVAGLPAVVPVATPEMKGSPYVFQRWLPAHLTLSNKLPLAPVPLKYDVLHQRLLMRADFTSRDSLQLSDQLVTSFLLDEPAAGAAPARQRLFQRFSDAPDARNHNAYVEVLHQGRYTLLKQYVKVLHAANFQDAYSSHIDEVEDREYYFLRRPDTRVVPVKLNLKALTSAAPELAEGLKKAAAAAKTDTEWAAALDAIDPTLSRYCNEK